MAEQKINTSKVIQTVKILDSVFNTEQLLPEELRRFSIAMKELEKTIRGKVIIDALEEKKIDIIIKMNNSSRNKYHVDNKTLEWDSNRTLFSASGKIIDAISLLGHELGHAYQDIVENRLLTYDNTEIKKNENDNIRENEVPIARERNNYLRTSHDEILLQRPYTLKIFRQVNNE